MINKQSDKIIIFSDGASKGNPGPGGWGSIVIKLNVHKVESEKKDGIVEELGGREKHTTNNRMELTGALKALAKIRQRGTLTGQEIIIYTDSKYLINGMTGWVFGWQKNGWQKKKVLPNGEVEWSEILNLDLWQKLVKVVKPHSAKSSDGARKIKWHYVGGHIGVAGNERCDEIASDLAEGKKVRLFKGKIQDYKIDILNLKHNRPVHQNGHPALTKAGKGNRGKAYSYLSLVGGILNIDQTWPECEKRVKGKAGAKYKKALSEIEEQEIIRGWGLNG